MSRRVTVECSSGAGVPQTAIFELFEGRLPVVGIGGLLLGFRAEALLWEDSSLISADGEGLSQRRVAEGVRTVRVLRACVQLPGTLASLCPGNSIP